MGIRWASALVPGGPSSSEVVSPGSYSSTRRADSAAEDIDDQVKDCNNHLKDED